MKSVLYKLFFVTIILCGWIVYDKRDAISDFISTSGNKIPTQVSDLFSSFGSSSNNTDKVTTTTVYKWKDKNGEIQFSNTKPAHMPNAEIQQFRSDTNVVAAVKAPPEKKAAAAASTVKSTPSSNDKKEEKSAGVLDSITGKMDEIAKIKKAIETPKTIPTR